MNLSCAEIDQPQFPKRGYSLLIPRGDKEKLLPDHPLKRWRLNNKRSLAHLAETAGVSISYISKLENWRITNVGVKTGLCLEEITGIPRDTFLYPEYYCP